MIKQWETASKSTFHVLLWTKWSKDRWWVAFDVDHITFFYSTRLVESSPSYLWSCMVRDLSKPRIIILTHWIQNQNILYYQPSLLRYYTYHVLFSQFHLSFRLNTSAITHLLTFLVSFNCSTIVSFLNHLLLIPFSTTFSHLNASNIYSLYFPLL